MDSLESMESLDFLVFLDYFDILESDFRSHLFSNPISGRIDFRIRSPVALISESDLRWPLMGRQTPLDGKRGRWTNPISVAAAGRQTRAAGEGRLRGKHTENGGRAGRGRLFGGRDVCCGHLAGGNMCYGTWADPNARASRTKAKARP